jgi:outer membrane protein assembly factor BamC
MQETQGSNKRDFKWVPHANNHEIEIAILQMMMARLGGETIAAANATPSAVAVAAVNVQLKDVADGKIIQLNEPFDKSWRKVGLALDKAHIQIEDKDRVSGFYLLRATSAAKGKKNSGYQVTVHESGTGCEVSVRNAEGKSDKESSRIIEALYQNIEK